MNTELSNIREYLGWVIGRKIVDVTAGDPPSLPDADTDDEHLLVVHLDNGGTLSVNIRDDGFSFNNPESKA